MKSSADNKEQASKSSKKARLSAARLAAVQAIYQMMKNEQDAASVIAEYKARRLGKPVDGTDMILPDGTLFHDIVMGVESRRGDLDTLLYSAESGGNAVPAETLLQALLLAGAYELMAHHDVDAPIIISDYLNVTHAFFDQGEARLVNGTLDRVKTAVRDQA